MSTPPLLRPPPHTQLSFSYKHTHTHTLINEHVIYLEVGRLCLVHSEPHENSELEVIGERLPVRERRNPH